MSVCLPLSSSRLYIYSTQGNPEFILIKSNSDMTTPFHPSLRITCEVIIIACIIMYVIYASLPLATPVLPLWSSYALHVCYTPAIQAAFLSLNSSAVHPACLSFCVDSACSVASFRPGVATLAETVCPLC